MAKPEDPSADPLSRATHLARQIASLFEHEDIFDAVAAVALVTSGIVHQYATGPAEARKLLEVIRHLEDRFLAKVLEGDDRDLDA